MLCSDWQCHSLLSLYIMWCPLMIGFVALQCPLAWNDELVIHYLINIWVSVCDKIYSDTNEYVYNESVGFSESYDIDHDVNVLFNFTKMMPVIVMGDMVSHVHLHYTQNYLMFGIDHLTHHTLHKMSTFSWTIFSDAFSWMKSVVFWLKFHWNLFLRVQLTITQHWFR